MTSSSGRTIIVSPRRSIRWDRRLSIRKEVRRGWYYYCTILIIEYQRELYSSNSKEIYWQGTCVGGRGEANSIELSTINSMTSLQFGTFHRQQEICTDQNDFRKEAGPEDDNQHYLDLLAEEEDYHVYD
jgi:hypothetical protein